MASVIRQPSFLERKGMRIERSYYYACTLFVYRREGCLTHLKIFTCSSPQQKSKRQQYIAKKQQSIYLQILYSNGNIYILSIDSYASSFIATNRIYFAPNLLVANSIILCSNSMTFSSTRLKSYQDSCFLENTVNRKMAE